MSEPQQRDWKAVWRDEYLKWICGFANAEGGVLEVGRSDVGEPVGAADAVCRLELIPDKVRIPIQISVWPPDCDLEPRPIAQVLDAATTVGQASVPSFNPLLASAFFRAGYVEAWGRGIEKVLSGCCEHNIPAPLFDSRLSGLIFTFPADPAQHAEALGEEVLSVSGKHRRQNR